MATSNSHERAEGVESRHLSTLKFFTTRARRVEEHSLASDKDQLLGWARGTTRIFRDPPTLIWNTPSEELLDSLAARCRPFILRGDSVHYVRVLSALGYFIRDSDEELAKQIASVRGIWRKLDPDNKGTLGYESFTGSENDAWVSDKTLAYAWLYNDLVHADNDLFDRVGNHDIDSRYRGGVLLITNIAVQVIVALNILRAARKKALIDLDEELFTRRVVARHTFTVPLASLTVGPAGTSKEELLQIAEENAEDGELSSEDQ